MKAGSRAKRFQVALGLVYPGTILLLGLLPLITAWQSLPERISIHFDLSRTPTLSLSKQIFASLMAGFLCTALMTCVLAAASGPVRGKHQTTLAVSFAGFVSAATASLMAGAVKLHAGLDRWDQAVGPGWWILTVIVAGLVGAKVTEAFYHRSLERG